MSSLALDLDAVRYDPLMRGGHVESYFLKATDLAGERALWIKATIYASTTEPDRTIAEGWAIAFDRRRGDARSVAVKHALSYDGASFSAAGLDVRWRLEDGTATPDALLFTAGATSGRVTHREHRITWDLRSNALAPAIVPFPKALYAAPLPRMKSVTPVPSARLDGAVVVDGERWEVSGWRGMQGHNWGRAHAERYAWAHVNAWDEDEPLILEAMSGDLRLGPVPLPRATVLCVRHRGVAYDFNTPLDLLRTRSDIGLRRWEFTAENASARIEGTIEAQTGDFVGLYYPNPDGSMLYCLNASLAHARIRFEADGEPPQALTSRAAALEIGTPDEDHGVKMYV